MRFGDQVSLGFRTYSEAFRFVAAHKLWLYIIIPGIVNIILFLSTWSAGNYYAGEAVNTVLSWMGLGGESTGFWSWIKGIVFFFVNLGVRLLVILLYLTFYKYIILIIMSPVLALLSERTEEILTGNKYPFRLGRFLRDVGRGIVIAVRNIFLELLLTLLFWLLSFLPLIGLLSPVMMFFVQSYFYGFSMMDYSNERFGLGVNQSISFIRQHKTLATTNGTIFYLLFLVPFIGWMVAPTLGVVAATLAVHQIRMPLRSAV